MADNPDYDTFWLNYLRAHSRRRTRAIHYCGITIILAGIVAAVVLETWWLAPLGIAAGYVTAWAAHLTVQGNTPVMFRGMKSALMSLVSGLRMYALGMTGRLKGELRRAGVSTA